MMPRTCSGSRYTIDAVDVALARRSGRSSVASILMVVVLPGAVRADEAEDVPLLQLEGEVFDRDQVFVLFTEVLDFDHGQVLQASGVRRSVFRRIGPDRSDLATPHASRLLHRQAVPGTGKRLLPDSVAVDPGRTNGRFTQPTSTGWSGPRQVPPR